MSVTELDSLVIFYTVCKRGSHRPLTTECDDECLDTHTVSLGPISEAGSPGPSLFDVMMNASTHTYSVTHPKDLHFSSANTINLYISSTKISLFFHRHPRLLPLSYQQSKHIHYPI